MRNSLTHRDFALKPLKTISSGFFSISLLSTTGKKARFSCVASKKVSLKAVERNRIKRQVRALARELLKEQEGAFVVNIKKTALAAPLCDIQVDLQKLIDRLCVG